MIAEALVALVLADAMLEKFGGDSMVEVAAHVAAGRALGSPWPGGAG